MISSEVHRTLVKSPPELWTELSDPDSLARHLGEFGEIRITRVKTEELVEWEADGARGTVVLKPSGWGTKVTLKVTGALAGQRPARTTDPQNQPSPDLAPQDPGIEPADETDTQTTPEIGSGIAPELILETAPEPILEIAPEPEPEPVFAPEPILDVAPEPVVAVTPETVPEIAPEPLLPAAAEVVLPAAAEPVQATAPEPVLPAAAEAEPPVESAPHPYAGSADRLKPLPEITTGMDTLLEQEPRRGLFARIFGRRRPAPIQADWLRAPEPVVSPEPAHAAPAEPTPVSEVLLVPPEREFVPVAQADAGAPGEPVPSVTPVEAAAPVIPAAPAEPPEDTAPVISPAPVEAAAPVIPPAPVEAAAPVIPAAPPEAAAPVEAAAPPETAAPVISPEPARALASSRATAPEERGGEIAADEAEEAMPGEAPGNLSQELREAEDQEAEQVKMVLTSVLDRLGAAHHRPFSRS